MKTKLIDIEGCKHNMPHWGPAERNALRRALKAGATLAYWNSTAQGQSANGGTRDFVAKPGLVVEARVKGLAPECCGPGAVHATLQPHKWNGVRVWLVAMYGPLAKETDKIGALRREFIGEIVGSALDHSVGAKIGLKNLYGADLSGANLRRADLSGANLRGADLRRARAHIAPDGWRIQNGLLVQV